MGSKTSKQPKPEITSQEPESSKYMGIAIPTPEQSFHQSQAQRANNLRNHTRNIIAQVTYNLRDWALGDTFTAKVKLYDLGFYKTMTAEERHAIGHQIRAGFKQAGWRIDKVEWMKDECAVTFLQTGAGAGKVAQQNVEHLYLEACAGKQVA
ncbi:hypothetical protein HDV00_007009 [Rhizophlyctis rosea]|nr:hypothetical protein HDV00_007009 [Rhizophlyctis rosea]